MPTLPQRLARIAPYLRSGRRGLALAMLGAVVGALTELRECTSFLRVLGSYPARRPS